MNFAYTDKKENLAEHCRKFAEEVIAPQVKELETDLDLRKNLFKLMAFEGFFSLSLLKRMEIGIR